MGEVIKSFLSKGWTMLVEYHTSPWDIKFTTTLHLVIYILLFAIIRTPPIGELIVKILDSADLGNRLLAEWILSAGLFSATKTTISKIDLKSSIYTTLMLCVIILGQRVAWDFWIKKRAK